MDDMAEGVPRERRSTTCRGDGSEPLSIPQLICKKR